MHHRHPVYNLNFQAQALFFLKQGRGGYKQAIICQCEFLAFEQFELSGLSGKYFFLSPFGNRQIYQLKSLWTCAFITRAEEEYLLKIIFCKAMHTDYGQPNFSCSIHNVIQEEKVNENVEVIEQKNHIETNTNIDYVLFCFGFFPS